MKKPNPFAAKKHAKDNQLAYQNTPNLVISLAVAIKKAEDEAAKKEKKKGGSRQC